MENKALINLFNEQLKNEIKKIVSEEDLENDGQGLIWWYFRKIFSLTDDEIEGAICDGGGDLGIDAILKDNDEIVHFYQFKNLSRNEKGFPTGDVDKTISGLELIIRRKYDSIANEKLKNRIKEVLETISGGYQMHFVSTGIGLENEARIKIHAFILSLDPPSDDFFKYTDENIEYLQDVFYTKSLPTLNETIQINLDNFPYMVRTANHDSYLFHIAGDFLAGLYEKYGEKILQQNIRMLEVGKPTNEAILRSCTGDDSENFYHYNNGVSFLCEYASWDAFSKIISMKKPQIVNGGQTVRILSKAKKNNYLKQNVIVPVRIITSHGDKEFAGNVAVNLNNQTRVEGSFLKSNNPRIVQLAASLRTLGWYLERREGEIIELEQDEKEKIESSIGGLLSEKTIPLKEGTQAYVATFYGNPGLARLNPARMFLDISDGGQFTKIFDQNMTAERFAEAFMLYKQVEKKINQFKLYKRRKKVDLNWKQNYEILLGNEFVGKRQSLLEQVVPQSTIFVIGFCFQWYIIRKGYKIEQLIQELDSSPDILSFALEKIIETQESGGEKLDKSWQSLLKSQEFFQEIKAKLDLEKI